jgi:hypothetical protein
MSIVTLQKRARITFSVRAHPILSNYFKWSLPNGFSYQFDLKAIQDPLYKLTALNQQSLAFKEMGLILSDVFVMYGRFNEWTFYSHGDPLVTTASIDGNVLAVECILQVVGETMNASYIDGIF